MASLRWKELSRYAACDLADGLLKLHVPGAGFLPDITPLVRTTPHSTSLLPRKLLAPATTFLLVPKSTPSFPSPSTLPAAPPPTNLPTPPAPIADYTDASTILIVSQPAHQSCAAIGSIMATRMSRLGATGLVVDGRVRDIPALHDTGLPIWSKGTSIVGAGAETKLHAKNVPVQIGGVTVWPGDIVMCDESERGVVVVPKERVEELLEVLPGMVQADERVLGDVEGGGSVEEAFKRHRG